MDPSIWSNLPGDLLERIVSLLPLRSLLNLRATCKRFQSLILSPTFLSTPPSLPSFLILSHPQFSHRLLPIYSTTSSSWRTAPLPHLLSSSSSGLLLFSLPSSTSLLISNPLTSSSRLIPTPTTHHPSSPTLITTTSPHAPQAYHIFFPTPSNSFYLYSSLSTSWTLHPSPTLTHCLPFSQSIFFTTLHPLSILAFHLTTHQWDHAPAPALPADITFIRLVAGGKNLDKLYLVGGVGSDGISRSLRVWEMVEGGWEEVGRLPEMMCRKFMSVCFHNYGHVYCIWHEGMICLCCTTWPEVLFFKMARGVWNWLPRCPLLQEKWSCGFRWLSFVPNLYALV